MTDSVELDVELSSPIDRVWNAPTDSAILSKWMMFKTNDFKPELGHTFQLRDAPGYDGVIDCEVKTLDEPHELAYTWETEGVDGHRHQTLVTFTLTETGDGTKLQVVQSGFREGAQQELGGAKYGWTAMLDGLKATIDG